MRRRELVGVLTGVVAPASVGRAQGRTYSLVVLTRPGQDTDLTRDTGFRYWKAWRDELQRLGYVEGQNLAIERYSVGNDIPRDEVVRLVEKLKPDVIYAAAQNLAEMLKTHAAAPPVVTTALDPVGTGLAASLGRPGANVTGLSLDAGLETMAKRFDLLKEIAPMTSRIGVLSLRQYWEGRLTNPIRDAAQQVGMTAIGAPLDPPMDEVKYLRSFADMARSAVDSIYVSPSVENLAHARLIGKLAIGHKLPTMCFWRENVEAGSLMAYAVDLVAIWRRAAQYIDRLLKGAKAADLPFEQPTKFELIINLKTAKALGLTVNSNLLARADEVIE